VISFKDAHVHKSVELYSVFFYVRYGVSDRDLKGITAKRGEEVGHTTQKRWVLKYALQIAANTQSRMRATDIPGVVACAQISRFSSSAQNFFFCLLIECLTVSTIDGGYLDASCGTR